MTRGVPGRTSGWDRVGGGQAAAQGHTGSSVPAQLHLPGHLCSPALLPQGPSQIPGALATAPSQKEALTHPSSEGQWRTFCIPVPPLELGAQSWEKAQRFKGAGETGWCPQTLWAHRATTLHGGHGQARRLRTQASGHPCPPAKHPANHSLCAQRPKALHPKDRQWRGRAGQGWLPRQRVQWPLQPPGSTQQSEAPLCNC